jgi:hypothetical protein
LTNNAGAKQMTTNRYAFTYCNAAVDGSLYVTGVVVELEDKDVRHAILWERVNGEWKRYKWNNRCYGLVTYLDSSKPCAVYLGYEGTLKVRGQVKGSTVQALEVGDDGPSSLRSVTCIRQIGNQLFVVGMRRMVYRRGLEEIDWHRFDDGMRLLQSDDAIAGLRSIDGTTSDHLVAVGLDGEIWSCTCGVWRQEESPTNIRLATIRYVGAGKYVIGGAEGVLLVGNASHWHAVTHSYGYETFRCIEGWAGRCFVCSESEQLFELHLDDVPRLELLPLKVLPTVNWVAATEERAYFLGRNCLWSLGADGWRDESPPSDLMTS